MFGLHPAWARSGALLASLLFAGCSGAGSSLSPLQSGSAALPLTPAKAGAPKRASTKSLVSPSAYASAVLSNTPVAFYQLGDTSTTMTDAGAGGFNGTYGAHVSLGSPAITTDVNAAAGFPGATAYDPSSYAFVAPNAAFQLPQVSMEAWFTLTTHNVSGTEQPLVVYGSQPRGVRYGLFDHGLGGSGDALEWQQRNAGSSALIVYSNTHLALNKIYHVVVTNTAGSISLYINGNLDKTVSYPGSIDYTPYGAVNDGLQIGGADQNVKYSGPNWSGSVADVAVYANPLTAAQVNTHFLAGQLIPMVTETPANADRFVDSIGVNAHFDNPDGMYGTSVFPTVSNLLVSAGIRHIRAAINYNNSSYRSEMDTLAAAGIHGIFTTALSNTQSQITGWPAAIGSIVEGFEAPNEQDDVGNANWLPECQAFQQTLYSWVKGNPATSIFPVLGPALVGMNDRTAAGDLSAYLDEGNIHDYMAVFNPGTYGWGGTYPPYGVYGSIPFNVNLGKVTSGNKPMIATETGYGTIAGDPMSLDYRTHLRYMTRLFFEQFNGGIYRSYAYEFMDEGGTAQFNNFGLVTTALQPKPAYTGIKSIIHALADPGPAFPATPLTYNITGYVNNVHHTLLQKRNGHYVLAIWLEVPDWVTLNNAGGDIIVPNQTVTLTTAQPFTSAVMSTMDETGALTATPLSWSGTAATFPVSDTVSLIDLGP